MATHSAPFLSLPPDIARYVLVESHERGSSFTAFEPSDLDQLDAIAQTLTFDRGELLGAVAVWLVVEGQTDVVVLRRLFARELHYGGIGVIPLHGTAYSKGILEADALWRYTRVPVAVMFDNVPPEQVFELLKASNDELKVIETADKKQRPPEVGQMARLVRLAREAGRDIHPVPNSGTDMLSLMNEDVLKDITDGKFPGHKKADEQWNRHNKGSRDEFYKTRYGLEKRPDLFGRIADLMAERGDRPPELTAAIDFCTNLGASDVSARRQPHES